MHRILDIPSQIKLLKDRGMVFGDEKKAAEILGDIGFYRLGFYMFPFEKTFPRLRNRNHKYKSGTTFEAVVDLYYFDFDLRQILTKALNRIEVNIKTAITNIVSLQFPNSPTWFVDSNVISAGFISSFDTAVYSAILKNPVIKRHHTKYINDKYAPAWKTIEFMTLGNICIMYDSIKSMSVKTNIANQYGCTVDAFSKYLNAITILRNKCAHGACLYNLSLAQGIKINPAGIPNETRQFISGEVGLVVYLLNIISTHRADELKDAINRLFNSPRDVQAQQVIESCTKISHLNFVGSK